MCYHLETFKVNDWHYRMESWNDHCYSCLDLLLGTEKALLIDTGYGGDKLLPAVRAITDLPLIVAITHGHGDHAGGADLFDQVMISRADHEMVESKNDHPLFAPLAEVLKQHPPKYVSEGDIIDIGGIRLTCISTPGHTPGGISYYHDAAGEVYTSDAICPAVCLSPPIPECLEDLSKSIDKIVALRPDTIWYGHNFDPMNYDNLLRLQKVTKMARIGQNLLPIEDAQDAFLCTTDQYKTEMTEVSMKMVYTKYIAEKDFCCVVMHTKGRI